MGSAQGLNGLNRRSLTCSIIRHTGSSVRTHRPESNAHTYAPPSDGHERRRCSKQERTTLQSIQFNISAEWTLLCVGIRTRPMGWRTFVLIYWCTQASVGEAEDESILYIRASQEHVANEICPRFGRLGRTAFLPTFKAGVKVFFVVIKI